MNAQGVVKCRLILVESSLKNLENEHRISQRLAKHRLTSVQNPKGSHSNEQYRYQYIIKRRLEKIIVKNKHHTRILTYKNDMRNEPTD